MQRIIFRTDGNTAVGMGHVIRCVALADMLKENFEIVFAVQERSRGAIQKTEESVVSVIQNVTKNIIQLPAIQISSGDVLNFVEHINEEDIVVLDGYNFDPAYQSIVLSKGCKLVCIEDWKEDYQFADVIINHSGDTDYSNYISKLHTEIYAGFKYALLRKEFLNVTSSDRALNRIKSVFISMGAADIHNLTRKFGEALIKTEGIEEIHLMLGSVNPHLEEIESFVKINKHLKIVTHVNISALELSKLLMKCDVAICPASSVALECCAIGIGLLSGTTANNQVGILNGLIKHEAAIDLGFFLDLSTDELIGKFNKYFNNPDLFNQMILNQATMIDGKSPERLLKIFDRLAKKRLRFRNATSFDMKLYFEWANDPLVRSNSYNQKEINYENHVSWFNSKLDSQKSIFYLFLNLNNEPVGQVRIDKGENETVIGISIDKNFRGKSYGVEMLQLATEDYLRYNSNATIVAYIKEENLASYKIFRKAGFSNEEQVVEQGIKSYKLYKNLMND